MEKTKRWGKEYKDKRDWPCINKNLIKRGEIFIDIKFASTWDQELSDMNKNKVGAPYLFPMSLIRYQAILHAKSIPFRAIQGACMKLCEVADLPAYCNYSTTNRRVNRLKVDLEIPNGNLRLFCDGCGFQVIEGGEYLRSKYGKKNRKWVQVVIWGDPDSKEPVSIEVNIVQDSEVDSGKRQIAMLKNKAVPIIEAGGDGAFDDIKLWNWLFNNGIWPTIKPDKNARDDSDSPIRNRMVKERNRYGYKKWARKYDYGDRWPATEGIFSAVKRIFGEQIHAKSEVGMVQEAKIKFWAYQQIKRYGES
jgi:hypothetical protein